jgi:ribosome biogenesis protein BMS1
MIVAGGNRRAKTNGRRALKETVNAVTAPKREDPEVAFASETAAMRARLAGHAPGTYVRIVLEGVPCEFIQHFNPLLPLVLGGVAATEQGESLLRSRLKKHRWVGQRA